MVFGGFSSDALRSRILDCDAHVVITADGGYRRGAAERRSSRRSTRRWPECPDVEQGARRAAHRPGRGLERPAATSGGTRWSSASPNITTREAFDAEHPLYIMYTSGTTAKPKGILHTSGGYLTHVSATHRLIFDLKPEQDVFWTAADIGWVTGHSYIVYGPLANGATSVMYEGTPDTPTRDRWWQIVERYKVNILYTAPTTIRTFMKWGEDTAGPARPLEPPPARLGGRADQPRGLDLVPHAHRRRALPHRRHLVADRDRRHHDHPAARASPPPSPARP